MDLNTPDRAAIMLSTALSASTQKLAPLQTSTISGQLATPNEAITPPSSPPGQAQVQAPRLVLTSITSPTNPKLYTGSFGILNTIGKGAWSIVSLAESLPNPTLNGLPTPPTTPRSSADLPRQLLAIKAPSHKMARRVLLREAQTLTQLHRAPDREKHIVSFHGLHQPTGSLVLSYAPRTLASYISSVVSQSPTAPSSEPIIGTSTWLALAHSLIPSLSWLHTQGYAHGDLKPANILLLSPDPPTARLCDFSSTQPFLSPADRDDALTTAYASPELLAGYLKPGGGQPTPEADIWALGVTLLVAATGEEPYSVAGSEMQRLAMARQGLVLEGFGWRGAARLGKGGVAWRCAEGALERDAAGRWGVERWRSVVEMERGQVGA
ncbi:MAG: hypothetical protein MMC23_004899 [Stictis urceolatum]|nr:hypothetical protein [Stictis urceolata]